MTVVVSMGLADRLNDDRRVRVWAKPTARASALNSIRRSVEPGRMYSVTRRSLDPGRMRPSVLVPSIVVIVRSPLLC